MKNGRRLAALGALVLLMAGCGPAATATPQPTATAGFRPQATSTPGAAATATPQRPPPGGSATPQPAPTPAPTAVAAASPKYGGTLRARNRLEPSTWDPARYHGAEEHRPLNLIYDRLFEYNYGAPQCYLYPVAPALATNWQWANDTTLDVKLRSGVRFHEGAVTKGREVTANDMVYSFKRTFANLAFYKPLADGTESVQAVDGSTVRFKLKFPHADYVLQALAAQQSEILAADAAGPNDTWTWERHVGAGNGPFVLKRSTPGVKIELERNDKYYRPGLPYVDAVTLFVMPEESTVLAALRAKHIDVAQFYSTQLGGDADKTPSLRTQACGYTASAVVFMRTDQPPFNDVRVRRALSMAIDRKSFLDVALAGRGVPRWSPVHADFGDWALPLDQYPAAIRQYVGYSPDAAKELLKQSGYAAGFETSIVFNATIGGHVQAAEAITAMLAKVGVKASLRPMDTARWQSAVVGQNLYDGMVLKYASSTTLDEATYSYFRSGAPRNASWVSDPRLDTLLEAQRRALDERERKQVLKDIQIYLADQQYRLELPESLVTLVLQPTVRNVWYKTTGWVDAEFYRFAWLEK